MIALYLARLPEVAPEVDVGELARRSEGYVGWDAESLCKRASLEALKADRSTVTLVDFEKALAQITPWLTPDMVSGYRELQQNDCPHHYAF